MEPESFETYHVLLTRRLGFTKRSRWFRSAELWGSEIHAGRWATYDGSWLRAEFGDQWGTELRQACARDYLRIEGQAISGEREVLASGEGRSAEMRTAAPAASAKDVIAGMRRAGSRADGRRPGRGEAAFHLIEHAGRTYDEVPELMRSLGFPDVLRPHVPRLRMEGEKRLKRGLTCAYCEFA